MAAAQWTSIVQESQTWDEAVHLAAGLSYLKTRDFRMNPEHPPLGKTLDALPLLWMDVGLPLAHPSWGQHDELTFGGIFLYQNRLPADTILLAARSVTILLALVLAVSLAVWTRKHFGAPAALLALFLCATDPNLIAHGRYVTTDLIAALFIFLTVVSWIRYLTTHRDRDLVVAGALLGLALASKFSCVVLAPVLALLALLRRPVPRRAVLVLGIAALVVAALYAPRFRFPSHLYLTGLADVWEHNRSGHSSYLLGQISESGWWYYFPVVFAVKTPLAVLLLLAAGLWWVAARRVRPSFEQISLALAAAVFFAASMAARINLGVRHILPVYPLLFIVLATIVAQAPNGLLKRLLLGGALALQLYESARIYPHYLAFFNLAAGGPKAGPRYLLDSNIDWGQDVKKLAAYLKARDIPGVCIAYFGNANFEYYKVGADYLPHTDEPDKRAQFDCVAAASVTPLYGLYTAPGNYDWLRRMPPTAKIGYSIYVWDLRKKPAAGPRPPEVQ
ncbi:MAG: glycosyltransferase family 39 protein [Acidobacteria bacterium]|nr:glycosyltransferase family 39 protein [Acidobacteriota bacterium]